MVTAPTSIREHIATGSCAVLYPKTQKIHVSYQWKVRKERQAVQVVEENGTLQKPAMACFKMGNLPWNVCTSQLRSWATPKNHLRKAGALFTLMLNPAPKRGTVAFEWYHQTHCTVDSLNQRNTTANRVQSSWPTAK